MSARAVAVAVPAHTVSSACPQNRLARMKTLADRVEVLRVTSCQLYGALAAFCLKPRTTLDSAEIEALVALGLMRRNEADQPVVDGDVRNTLLFLNESRIGLQSPLVARLFDLMVLAPRRFREVLALAIAPSTMLVLPGATGAHEVSAFDDTTPRGGRADIAAFLRSAPGRAGFPPDCWIVSHETDPASGQLLCLETLDWLVLQVDGAPAMRLWSRALFRALAGMQLELAA